MMYIPIRVQCRRLVLPYLWVLVAIWVVAAGVYAESLDPHLISNVFVDTYITEALKDIAYQAQVNIVPDVTVTGYVTLELQNVPLDEALKLVLYPGGFIYKQIGNTYLVGSADPKSPLFGLLTTTESIELSYITATDAKSLLSDFYTKYARFDPSTNTVFVTGPEDVVERLKRDIALIDKPPDQIVIEVLVTELSSEARKALGLDLAAAFGSASKDGDTIGLETKIADGSLNVALNSAAGALRARITALAGQGSVTVRANPRLMVVAGNSAEIFIGKDRYYRLTSSGATTTGTRIESIPAGVRLKILPRVAADGSITLQVEPSVSDVSGMVMGEGLPIVTRRQATTTVRVKDGETTALGGLIQEVEQTGETKVPILGDLPIIRNLFKSNYKNSEETEIVIFLTPHIIK